MAPPTRLRPHLDDLLQKNLELEHVVADLRHQLTQSSAKWADERKTLATGCDALMASFAKFRARLDVQPSDWADSEGEVEQNLDTRRQSEEAVDAGMPETEREQGSSAAQDLHEICRTLAADLRAREEELEESQRKREASEEEIHRIQRLLETQSEQLREALASSKADTSNKVSPQRTPNSSLHLASPPKTGLENAQEKLDLANSEITRLKQLLQEWKKYGSDWKRDGQLARVRASELHRREDEFNTKIRAAEESKIRQDAEIQRLTNALADQTAAVEQQCTACQESARRAHDLETMVTRLRAQLSPEQLASFDSDQNQAAAGPPGSSQLQAETNRTTQVSSDLSSISDAASLTSSAQVPADTNTSKRSDMIMLRIPSRDATRSVRRPSTENNEPQVEQQNITSPPPSPQVLASQSIRLSPAPQRINKPPTFNSTDFEICIHTCNAFLCRNDSRSFLWTRKQPSLPRHVLSTKKHNLCSPPCPGYRLLQMPLAEAVKEPRRAKCRPPTEGEVALAVEEASKMPPDPRAGRKGAKVKEVSRSDSGSSEENEEPEGGSAREEEQERGGERPPRLSALSVMLGKRLRTRTTDSEERARKLRPRFSITSKT